MQIFTVSATISESSISSVDAVFTPGQICPIFTITLKPSFEGQLGASWADAITSMPSSVSISLLNRTWTCNLRHDDISVDADGGMTRTLQYVPEIMESIAERKSHGKDVYYYSVPNWIYGQLIEAIDTDNVELNHTVSNIYPDDGYTIDEIAEHFMWNYAGITLSCTIPTCHVQDQTIQYVAGSMSYLAFVQSLILSIPLEYVFFASDSELTVTTVEPEESKSLDPVEYNQGTAISASRDYLDEYTSFKFIGGYGEPVLADYVYENLLTQLPDQTDTIFEVRDETLGGEDITRHLYRTYQYDLFGKIFCITSKTEQIHGNVYNVSGEDPVKQFREEINTTYTHENQESLYYEAPRLLESEVQHSGYYSLTWRSQ